MPIYYSNMYTKNILTNCTPLFLNYQSYVDSVLCSFDDKQGKILIIVKI